MCSKTYLNHHLSIDQCLLDWIYRILSGSTAAERHAPGIALASNEGTEQSAGSNKNITGWAHNFGEQYH